MIDAATLTGLVDLTAPDPARITPRAIAHGLGQIVRWTGATESPVSVAQHSVLVYSLFRELFPTRRAHGIHALLHDAHEYLIGDISRPAERLLEARSPGLAGILVAIKQELDTAIRTALGVAPPLTAILDQIRIADEIAADCEWKRRLPASNGPSPFSSASAGLPRVRPMLKILTWVDAADLFRETLERELAERAWEKAA
jgi:hypothetical protein